MVMGDPVFAAGNQPRAGLVGNITTPRWNVQPDVNGARIGRQTHLAMERKSEQNKKGGPNKRRRVLVLGSQTWVLSQSHKTYIKGGASSKYRYSTGP